MTSDVVFKKVKVSDKGQVSLPVDVQRRIGIEKGDELLLIMKDQRVILEKPTKMLESLEDEFEDVSRLTEEGLSRLWLTKKEDVWDKYLTESAR